MPKHSTFKNENIATNTTLEILKTYIRCILSYGTESLHFIISLKKKYKGCTIVSGENNGDNVVCIEQNKHIGSTLQEYRHRDVTKNHWTKTTHIYRTRINKTRQTAMVMVVSHCGEYMANGLTNAVRHEFVMIAYSLVGRRG